MSYQNEWLLFEAEDEFDEIKHREPTEELLFYRAVASGDIKTVKKNCERQRFTECDGVGVLSKNAVTNMKYHFVITTAMITRLCKQNGMEMEQAFRLSDFYIQKLDGIHTVEEVQSLHDEMVMDYTEKMRRYFRDNTYSKHINASKEYIYSHIKERITIEDLADSLGVSARYLTRLFKNEASPRLSDYFSPATTNTMSPDSEGFIQRWLLLEPIDKPNRSNTVFTDSYIREAFATEYFPNQFTVLPKDGDKVKIGKQKLTWHALDSKLFNVKLFRFASGLKKQVYGVLFWAVTVIECPEDMENIRMSVGSNSASMWWLNGEEAVILSGDRRMVKDDCLSRRLTLKKGKNIIRGAIINGPGMSDFCVRFLNENGTPVNNITISYK